MHEHGKHPEGKKPYRKGHPDHTHLVCFKPIMVVKMRESLKNTSRKRKLDQNGKIHFHALGQVVKMEVGLWLGLEGENHNDFSFGVMWVFPGRMSLFGGKTQWKVSFKLA